MKLTCTAVFLLLLSCVTHTLGIKIQSTPPFESDGVIQVELEKTVSLVCEPHDSLGADEELVWLRNGAKVKLNDENKKGSSSVCVSPVTAGDNDATFTCHLLSNASHSASVTLNVTYHSEDNDPEEVSIEEEETLVLECDMRANPIVSSVSWKLNGTMVDLLAGGFTVTSDGAVTRLQVKKVEESLHEGTYECTRTSPVYGDSSKRFHVTVSEKTLKFPLMPMIAGLVVVGLTALLAVVSRWKRIVKCCK